MAYNAFVCYKSPSEILLPLVKSGQIRRSNKEGAFSLKINEYSAVTGEVERYANAYKIELQDHPNPSAACLMNNGSINGRLKRKIPQDLIRDSRRGKKGKY